MAASAEAAVEVASVSKRFGSVVALDEFDLELFDGEFQTILGPSGCGKTTALRVIAGFERPDKGAVLVTGQLVSGPGRWVSPEKRRVGMVFQDFALFPHLNVKANVGYGRGIKDGQVERLLELVGMKGMEHRFPDQLSGGEQQRVALARALAPEPRVVLLDEPFSNLDAALRSRVRNEVKSILEEAGATALFVTHDQEEALSLSDRVSVMTGGRIVQYAPPSELYRRPANAAVAAFLGEADFLPAVAEAGLAHSPIGSFPTELKGSVQLMVRPENVVLVADLAGDARVLTRQFFGHDQLVTVEFPQGERLRARLGPGPDFQSGDQVAVKVEEALVFPI